MNTVNIQRIAMEHAVTEYDRRREGKVGYHPYALPQYLVAVDQVCKAVEGGQALRKVILSVFSGYLATAVLRSVGEPPATREEI